MALLPALAVAAPANHAWQPLRELEQQHDQQERERRQRQLIRPSAATAEPPTAAAEPEPCRPAAALRLRGNQLLSEQRLREAAAPHLAPCMGAQALNRLLAALTAAYVERGYITARPYLVPSHDGDLEVVIVEGHVEGISVTDPSLPLSLHSAFGELPGAPLHLPTLERGMDQLNRLRVFDLASDIRPGATPGASRIELRPLSYPPRAWFTGKAYNTLPAGAGRHGVSADYQVESPLSLNDRAIAGIAHSLESQARFYRSAQLMYQVPYGPWQLSAVARRYQYQAQHPAGAGRLQENGGGAHNQLVLERELWRSQQALASGTLQLNHKRIDTLQSGSRVAVLSPRYASADLKLNLLWLGWSSFSGQLRYSEGLGGWSANDGQPTRAAHPAQGRFQAWGLALGHSYASQAFGQAWQWNSQFAGQYSNDSVAAMDQFPLAGDYAVRGFRDVPSMFASGVTWNNTVTFPRSYSFSIIATPRLGLDAGLGDGPAHTRQYGLRGAQGVRLAGAAVGVNIRRGDVQLDLQYQHPLYHSGGPTPGGYWQAEFEVRL